MLRLAVLFCALLLATPTFAARCGGDFNTFVATMSQEAQAAGISPAVISQALSGVTQDPAVLAFDRSVRVMQCGLFLLLMLLCRFLRNYFRQHVFGIALGFGVFASIELIVVSIVMHYGEGPVAIVSLMKSAAYNAVTLLWIIYLRRPSESIPEIEVAPQLNALNMALVASTHPGGNDFLVMVEDAVDRVLSRGSWPRPSAKGSQIVSRKPEPEERN